MNRPALRVVLLAMVAMFALSGCFKVDIDISVQEDGSGQAVMISAISYEDVLSMAELMGGDDDGAAPEDGFNLMPTTKEEICSEGEFTMDEAPEGAEVEEYDEDGYCGIKTTVDFADADELAEVLEMFNEAGEGTSSSVEITRDGEEWIFEASLETEEGASLVGEDAGSIPFDGLFDSAQFQFHVQLPGEAIEHNADEVDGNRFTWNLDPMQPSQDMMARTGPASSSSSLMLIVIGVALIAAVVAGGFWLIRRGRNL